MNEPAILSANTWFWKPSSCASGRRRSERLRQAEVAEYLRSLGLDVEERPEMDKVVASGHGLEVEFYYRESCTSVYKTLVVRKGGKLSNIRALRAIAARRAAEQEPSSAA
jgi:hypothetical protein